MTSSVRVLNWDRWQSYRSDRGQPPWIKLHRRVRKNPEWLCLNDAQRGQLIMLWIVAADEKGFIKGPATDRISLPTYLKSACHLTDEPDLQLLSDLGFIEFGSHVDGPMASTRRQGDAKVTPARRPQTQKKTQTQTQKKIIQIPSSVNGLMWMMRLWPRSAPLN